MFKLRVNYIKKKEIKKKENIIYIQNKYKKNFFFFYYNYNYYKLLKISK